MKRKTHAGYARTKVTPHGDYFRVQVEQDHVVYSDEYDENWTLNTVTLETEKQDSLALCPACDERLATKLCAHCRGVLLCKSCAYKFDGVYYCPFCYEETMKTLADVMRERKDSRSKKQLEQFNMELSRLAGERIKEEFPKLIDRLRHHERSRKRRLAEGKAFERTVDKRSGLVVLPENTPPGTTELPRGATLMLQAKIIDVLIEGTMHNAFFWTVELTEDVGGYAVYRTTFDQTVIEFSVCMWSGKDSCIRINKDEIAFGCADSYRFLYEEIQKQLHGIQ